jgi:hypothetical protein
MMLPMIGSRPVRLAAAAAALATSMTASVVAQAGTRPDAGGAAAYPSCDLAVLPAGVCATSSFLPGMRVRVPAGGWQSGEDSPAEFKLYPPGYAADDSSPGIRFWLDPRASTPCSDKRLPVDMTTPARVLRWLRSDENLIVSASRQTTIAGHLAATSVDVDVRPNAPRCSPGCPAACIDYFLFSAPGAGTRPYGTGPGELVRLYVAKIGPPSHVLLVGTDVGTPRTKAVFATLNTAVAKMLAGLHLPATLPPARP